MLHQPMAVLLPVQLYQGDPTVKYFNSPFCNHVYAYKCTIFTAYTENLSHIIKRKHFQSCFRYSWFILSSSFYTSTHNI